MKKLKVGTESAGIRADVFVASQYPDFTRSSLERLFDMDSVSIKRKPIKGSYRTKNLEVIEVDDELLFKVPDPIELPVIYEDNNVLVMDKPAGILTHSKGALNTEATVASFIAPKLNDKKLVGNRAGIVHRLDRPTSGVIIAAKNEAALKWLQKQFSTRRVKKTYLAVVEDIPEPPEAIIDAPIIRNPKKPQTFRVDASGKPARTKYKILSQAGDECLLEITPETGRTHQIRVHLAYIGHSVVGDSEYGHPGEDMMLHATRLELTLPGGIRKVFSARPPAKFGKYAK